MSSKGKNQKTAQLDKTWNRLYTKHPNKGINREVLMLFGSRFKY